MDNTHTKQNLTKSALRHYGLVMAFAVLCIGLGVGSFFLNVPKEHTVVQEDTSEIEATSTVESLSRSMPTRLRIPSIGLDTTFEEPVGLNKDQTIQVPTSYEEVAWYKNGSAPGEIGPAVILGHVDTYKGPAVFFSLGQLKEGDEIIIDRYDGTTAVFEVTNSQRFNQDNFPTELVYGPVPYPALRLVTCSGIFNKLTQKYSHNTVVFAVLKETTIDNVVQSEEAQ